MGDTGGVSRVVEMVPFEEALREMQSGPLRNDQLSRVSAEIPLFFAVAALFALYFAG